MATIIEHVILYKSIDDVIVSDASQYNGKRDIDHLISFLMLKAPPAPIIPLIAGSLKPAISKGQKPWLVSFCYKTDG